MELSFKGDATEFLFLIQRMQEIQKSEPLADVIVNKLPNALIEALHKHNES